MNDSKVIETMGPFHKGPFVRIERESGFCGDTSIIQAVPDRDPLKVLVPEYYLGFHFFDLEFNVSLEINDRNEFQAVMVGVEEVNKSPTYFVGGRLITLKDVHPKSGYATRLRAAKKRDPRFEGYVHIRYWDLHFRKGDVMLPSQNNH